VCQLGGEMIRTKKYNCRMLYEGLPKARATLEKIIASRGIIERL
jgi:hypothetical protein